MKKRSNLIWISGIILLVIVGVVIYNSWYKSKIKKAVAWFIADKKKNYEQGIDLITNGTPVANVWNAKEIINWYENYIKDNMANFTTNDIVLQTFCKIEADSADPANRDKSFAYDFVATIDKIPKGLMNLPDAAKAYNTFLTYTEEQKANILRSSFKDGSKIGTQYKPFFLKFIVDYWIAEMKDENKQKTVALAEYEKAGTDYSYLAQAA